MSPHLEMRVLILVAVASVLICAGCSSKKPHGTYTARFGERTLSYDFRQNGDATFTGTFRNIPRLWVGRWTVDSGQILVYLVVEDDNGEYEVKTHTLKFDGDDLFNEAMAIRFVRGR